MNELKLLESIRPEARPMDHHERAAIRAELFGDAQTATPPPGERPRPAVEVSERDDQHSAPARRPILAAAAAGVIVLGVSAVWMATALREATAPAKQPAITGAASTVASSTPNLEAVSGAPAIDELEPSWEYQAAVWSAREIVIRRCMAALGFEYQLRPFVPTNDAAWLRWDEWFDEQTATSPTFEEAMLGGLNEQAGGCQLDAYRAVHGPGEEAYSKLSGLLNQMLADLPTEADRTDAKLAEWVEQHRLQLDAIHAELSDEQATAQTIIDAEG